MIAAEMYQPYFAAWLRDGGTVRDIPGYIAWINRQWRAFYAAHPNVSRGSDTANRLFPAWLAQATA